MKCDNCHGTGNVSGHPYRAAANKVKEVIRPVGNAFTRAKSFMWKKVWKKVRLPLVSVAFIVGSVFFISHELKDCRQKRVIEVQYDDHGKIARCWVSEHYGDVPGFRDHYAIEWADQESQVKDKLKYLGADDNIECIRVK